ncbi:uncharacterized protein LOC144451345 [Glandiceps talaboti]
MAMVQEQQLRLLTWMAILSTVGITLSQGASSFIECNLNTSDFHFDDITSSSANISWASLSTDRVTELNISSVTNYVISYNGTYRSFFDHGDEKTVSPKEPRWFEVSGLYPWPMRYKVCLEIEYVSGDGQSMKAAGERGCSSLCSKRDYFDYYSIVAMASAGTLILLGLLSLAVPDPYQMKKDVEETPQQLKSKAFPDNVVDFTDMDL